MATGDGKRDGISGVISRALSNKDQAAHTQMKTRLDLQEVDLRKKLIEEEKMLKLEEEKNADVDPDEDYKFSSASEEEEASGDGDDELELLRELERIKREREEVKKEEEFERTKKLRWNHDIIFRSQRPNTAPNKKRFINDVIRTEFHRRFLEKYIK